jgi:hypothetical protein
LPIFSGPARAARARAYTSIAKKGSLFVGSLSDSKPSKRADKQENLKLGHGISAMMIGTEACRGTAGETRRRMQLDHHYLSTLRYRVYRIGEWSNSPLYRFVDRSLRVKNQYLESGF